MSGPLLFDRYDVDAFTIALRELRVRADLTQPQLARKSGVGEKSISSYESGARVSSLKVVQLLAIIRACGETFGGFVQILDAVTTDLRRTA